MHALRLRVSPATIISVIALVLAASGTAIASGVLITRSDQVASHVILKRHLTNSTVRALEPRAISAYNQLGSLGISQTAFDHISSYTKLATLHLSPGSYTLIGKAIPTMQGPGGESVSVDCVLVAGHDVDDATLDIGDQPGSISSGEVTLLLDHAARHAFDATVKCASTPATQPRNDPWVQRIRLTALRLGSERHFNVSH